MAEEQPTSAIKYQLSPKELRNLQDMFEESDVQGYFEKMSRSNQTHQMVSQHYSEKILTNFEVLFNEGVLQISKEKKKVEELMDENKINEEEKKAIELKAKKEYIEKQLEYLKLQTSIVRNPQEELFLQQNGYVLSKEQHKQQVLKLKKEKREHDKKHTEFISKMEQKQRDDEQLKRKLQQEKQKEEQRVKRESIQKKLQLHREKHDEFLRIEKESKQKLKELKDHKFVYQQLEDKYQNTIVYNNLEDKKRKLKQLRQYKAFNIQDLKQHERQYLEKKEHLKESRKSVNEDWSYQAPPRSERLTIILEEERLQKITKLEEKKKILDQKLTKQENFVNYLKENFVPRVDPLKREEIEKRLEKNRIERPDPADLKKIGMAYLEEAKKRKRKNHSIPRLEDRPETQRNATNLTANSQDETKSRAFTNYLSIDRSNDEHYQRRRRRNLQKILKKQDLSEPDKIKQLKFEAQKINQTMLRKQKQLKYKKDSKIKNDTLELLLSSIQAKIGIIQMYK